MRILILSFFYRPDISAGSFRTTALVEELSTRLGPGDEVHVLTTQPNRYESFAEAAPSTEKSGNVRIERISLPGHQSGMLDQSRAFAAYAMAVLRRTLAKSDGYDLVFATSSRLMMAVLGAAVANRTDTPLYLDIRDLLPVNLADMWAGRPRKMAVPLLKLLDGWSVRSADRINLNSPGFADYVREFRDDLDLRMFTNGIDEEFLDADFRRNGQGSADPTVILYAGNIGEGQALETVVPGAAEALGPDHEFWIVGDGGRREMLADRVATVAGYNVRLIDPVPRERLVELYRRADVLFLHLNDYDAFRRVLPSKIFEYAATGKPLLAGVAGHAREFIEEHVPNAGLFSPCDVPGLLTALESLEPGLTPRAEFIDRFRRSTITREMAGDVLDLAADT